MDADKDGHISFEEFQAGFKVQRIIASAVHQGIKLNFTTGLQCWSAGQWR